MRATAEATEAYHGRYPGIHTSVLGRTGLRVSGAGFGGYRVSIGVEASRQALRTALTSGINLIDTSANYADGGSEELIGATLGELIREGSLARNEVVIVTKGGYIQGSNYKMVHEKAQVGSGFPEVVEYSSGLWHCIAPEFLQDQITRSLNRLALRSVDLYLLHNPEYYLNWAAKHDVLLEDARREYYRRIGEAFRYLESEVEQGRIGWYGISSNSFPEVGDASNFTSLDEIVKIAESIGPDHHFAAIQFPANLVERGFVTEANQPEGRSLIELAHERDLGTLVNRPLNAIVGDRLIRLADFSLASAAPAMEDILRQIENVVAMEQGFLEEHLEKFADDPEGMRAIQEFISVGLTLQQYWQVFGSIEQYNDVMSQHFAPRLGYVSQYLRQRGEEAHIEWYASYLTAARALLHSVASHYSRDAQERSDKIRSAITAALGATAEGTLSALSIRLLLGVEGVDSVLVGMRRGEYVNDVLAALRHGPLGEEGLWKKLDLAEAIAEPEEESED
jgi:hypothetical protein